MSEQEMIKVGLCSGGRESTAMVKTVGPENYDLLIFANTGDDPNGLATVEYLNRYHNWNIVIVQSKYGNIYDYYGNKIVKGKKHGKILEGHKLPSHARKDCSVKFKVAPIRQYLRQTYGRRAMFEVHLGYSFSVKEIGRMNESDVSYVVHKFPLIERHIDREMCGQICKDFMGFIPERSLCDMCFERDIGDWKDFAKKNPERMKQIMAYDRSSLLFKKYGYGLWTGGDLNDLLHLEVPEGQKTLIQCGCFNGHWSKKQ